MRDFEIIPLNTDLIEEDQRSLFHVDRRDESVLGSHQNRCLVFRLASACTSSGSTGIWHWTRLILFLFMVLIGWFLLLEKKALIEPSSPFAFFLAGNGDDKSRFAFDLSSTETRSHMKPLGWQSSLPCDMAGSDGQRLNDKWWWLVTCSSCFRRGVRARDWDPLISVTWSKRAP